MKNQSKTETPALPHIGNLLTEYFKDNNTYRSGLARTLGMAPVGVYQYQKKESLQLRILWNISVALGHNFFADLAAQLPDTYSTNIEKDTSKDQEIKRLNKEVDTLTGKLELLKEILKQPSQKTEN